MTTRPRQTFYRYSRGQEGISRATSYGYEVYCECGWSARVNEHDPKRVAGEAAGDHAAEAHPIQKGESFQRIGDGRELTVSGPYPHSLAGDWLAWRREGGGKAVRVKPWRILNPFVYRPIDNETETHE